MAKLGDAESLFILGLAHHQGHHASNDLGVAERFFFFAAQNGKSEAQPYFDNLRRDRLSLESKHPAPTVDEVLKTEKNTAKITAQPDKLLKKEKLQEKVLRQDEAKQVVRNVSLDDTRQTETYVETYKVEKFAQVGPIQLPVGNDVAIKPVEASSSDMLIESSAGTKSGLQYNAAAFRFEKKKPTWLSVWNFLPYLLFTLVLMAFGLAFKSITRLPDDFDAQRYLALNPDVVQARMGAKYHFIRYGRFESRRY